MTDNQTEQNKKLEQRMYELMQAKNKNAYAEWKKFFDNEFTKEADISLMQILSEIVRAYPLQGDVVRLIIHIMTIRGKQYQTAGEVDKEELATQIIQLAQNQIPDPNISAEIQENYPRRKRKKVPVGIIIGIFIVFLIGVPVISSGISGTKKKEVLEQAVSYINEKYGDTGYTVEDLEAEKAYLYGDADEKLVAYYVLEKGKYQKVIYAVSEKGESDYTCFDNLQEREIKQAMQDEINKQTGRADGKLFWDSSSGSDGAIEDGYFHNKYDGDFSAFIEKETDVRMAAQKEREKRLHAKSKAKNGNCDYYLPDLNVETIQQRVTTEEFTKDEKLQEVLEKYAEKYQIQLRGMMLTKQYFDERIQKAAWDNKSLRPEDHIDEYYMEPTISFLMSTGWYVALPQEDADLMNVENGIYEMPSLEVGKGIYGTQDRTGKGITTYSPLEMKDSFIETEIPESTELTDAQKERAVSIRFKGNKELQQNIHLAVDKEVYGISDGGYRVFVTKITEDGEETEELRVTSYQDEEADLRFGDVLDGEGYVIAEYHNFYQWDAAPYVITIVNP